MVFSSKVVHMMENIYLTHYFLRLKEISQVDMITTLIWFSRVILFLQKGIVVIQKKLLQVFWLNPIGLITRNCWKNTDDRPQLTLAIQWHLSQQLLILLMLKLFLGFKVYFPISRSAFRAELFSQFSWQRYT